MHPAKEGFSSLPFFDEFDLSTVDILLISQYVDLSALEFLELRRNSSISNPQPTIAALQLCLFQTANGLLNHI